MIKEKIKINALRKVKTQTGLTLSDLQIKSRKPNYIRARRIYCFICYSEGLTQEEIAEDLPIDRSTVQNAIRTISDNDLKNNIGNASHAVDFTAWYTGLDRKMLARYYERYMKEINYGSLRKRK